jgi:UDP-N-acetylmuramoylalanine--D-glutamate ligase
MDDLKNKRVTVAGLGHFGGGIAVAKWLVGQGAQVTVTDLASEEELADSVAELRGLPVVFRLGGHELTDFLNTDLVVTSPAVKPSSKYITAARQAAIPVTTEIRLFIERCPAKIIAVTGTKGKSTATAMLGKMLEASVKQRIWVGGNIGKSLLPDLPQIAPDDLVVLELSSFMLEYLAQMRWSPHVALVTMLAVDHVDWHGSPEAYLEAKKSIVKFQRPQDFAVLGEGVPHTKEFAAATQGQVIWFNTRGRRFDLQVPGEHNQFNAQGAFATAKIFGVNWDKSQQSVKDFIGLPHRLQLVHEDAGVRYYNDSIATIPEAAIAALEAFKPRTVIQIVGGSDKGLAFEAMCNVLRDRAKAILCIGTTGPKISQLLQSNGRARAQVKLCKDLAMAMTEVKSIASEGDVVLLSTGCASYDQFQNFEQRGDTFARLAKSST